jgi:hypothetical protein
MLVFARGFHLSSETGYLDGRRLLNPGVRAVDTIAFVYILEFTFFVEHLTEIIFFVSI